MRRWTTLGLLAALWIGCGEAGGGGGADADAADGTAPEEIADDGAADPDTEDGAEGDEGVDMEGDAGDDGDASLPPTQNWQRDIRAIALEVDLSTLQAAAAITLDASDAAGASFEAGGLTVMGVSDAAGGPLEYLVTDGRLDVGAPASQVTLTVDYGFTVQADFEGWSSRGWTLMWPNHCGNLFPCHSSPAEGQTFALEVLGVAEGQVAVHPDAIPADAPSYQIAWAVGDYAWRQIGATAAGTLVGAWTQPGGETAAATGMADLPAVFDWYERTLGPYPFGGRAGALAVVWPLGAYGGMEHHPFWHVSQAAMGDRAVHVHEASHGWFGDGVRIARWEDLVLSEGTACYLTARSLGQVVGPDAETAIWDGYAAELTGILAHSDRVAWPDPIADPAELNDFLFSRVTYIKGAYFYEAVADAVGAAEIDRVLGLFFAAHAGEAAGMQDLVDLIESETGFDTTAPVEGWLRGLGRPD